MAAFTPGDLVIYRVGDGTTALANTGSKVFLDEYSPTGTLVQSIALPTTASGNQNPLVASGVANLEGALSRSADGRFLTFTGYSATIPFASSLPAAPSTTVPRVIGRVDFAGALDTSTELTDIQPSTGVRTAVTSNGTDFWVGGASGGIRYATLDAATSSSVSTTPDNLRVLQIFNNQLYVSTSSGGIHLGTIGTGLPTTSGQSVTSLPGFPASGAQTGFYLADLDSGVAGFDTLYVASDDAGALTKYSLVGGTWVSNGTIGASGDLYRGLTATVTGNTVTLFATRKGGNAANGGGEFVSLVDNSGYNGAFAGTPTVLATAATQIAFRGIALAPVNVNTAPTVSDVTNKTTRNFEPTTAIPFTVGDGQTAAGSLTVTATSSDQALVPDANITIGGSGANRTITVRPGPVNGPANGAVPGPATGTATITITVTDAGGLTATDTFNLAVTQAPTLDIGSVVGNPGDSIQIPIRLNTNGPLTPGEPFDSADLVILYDTNILTIDPIAASIGPDLQARNGGWIVGGSAPGPGVDYGKMVISISCQIAVADTFNGIIAYINAKINATAPNGISPVNLVRTAVVNGDTKTTFIAEDGFPSLQLGPVPTNASNDPISDGYVNVGNVALPAPPVNTVPTMLIMGTEDTNVPFTGGALSVADPNSTDTLTTTLSVTGTTVGTFTATNGGGTAVVTGSGTATLTIVGTQTQVNTALNTVTFIPAANRNTPTDGPTVVTMNTTDGSTTPDSDTFTIFLNETNDAPVPTADSLAAINEDAAPLVIPFASLVLNDSRGAPNESAQTLTVTGVSAPIGGTVNIVGTDVIFTPTPNYSGPASFTYTVIDNGTNGGFPAPLPGTGGASVSFTINSVNDAPSFLKGPDVAVNFNAPPQTVPTWATAISAGGGESGQILTFNVSNDNNTLFTAGAGQPAIASNGTLTFTPAAGVFGVATVTVTLMDDGGTANGGVNASAPQTFIIRVNSPGNAPTINAISNVTVNEDPGPQTVNFSGVTDGGDPSPQTITITATSNNPSVVPNPNVTYVGSPAPAAATGSLTFTPVANASGVATITVTVRDSGLDLIPGNADDLITTTNFTITVNPVNDPPTITDQFFTSFTAFEDDPTMPFVYAGISAGAGENQTLAVTATSSNHAVALDPTVTYTSPATTATVNVSLLPNQSGSTLITVTVRDAGFDGTLNTPDDGLTTSSFTLNVQAVNDRPTFTAANPPTVNEDAAPVTVPGFITAFIPGPSDEASQTVSSYTVNNVSNPSFFTSLPSVATNGTLSYTLAPNVNGTVTFNVLVVDNGGNSNGGADTSLPQTFTLTVNPINDRPTFTAANPPSVNEDSGAASVPGFISSFSGGPTPDELTQTVVSYNVSNVTNPTLFQVAPSVATNGTLTYTPAANAFGTATFDLTVTDNGGTANGGLATSTTQTFTITVNAVNDAPTVTIGGNQTVANGAPAQTVNSFASVTSVGPPNEAGQTVSYQVSNNNNGLFTVQPSISSTGVLTYTPAAGLGGTATVTVRGQDSGGTANGGVDLSGPLTFTITVNAPLSNATPTLAAISNVTINEDATLQTISLSGITDGGDSPSQALSITASSDNTALIPNPAVTYTSPGTTGSLTFTPVANANGTATITVTVRDSGLDLIPGNGDDGTFQRTFTVTVNAVNDVPSFTATSPAAVNEDAGAQTVSGFISAFNAGGGADETVQTPTYSVSAVSNPSLFLVQPTVNAAGQLSYTPAANAFGTSTFQVSVTDSGGTANGGVATSVPQTFTITVNSVNDAPSFVVGPNRTTPNVAGAQSLAGQASSISSGPANESAQTVSFSVSNNNTALFSVQPTIASNGTLNYTPAAGAAGTATVTVSAQDSGGTANGGVDTSAAQTFTITILNNNPPTINPLGNLVINQNSGVQAVSLTGITTGGEVQNLSVTATSSNTSLIPTPTISYVSPNATGTLNFAPAFNQIGTTTITVTVRDSSFDGILNTPDDGIVTTSFTVQVNDVNDPPVANDQTVPVVIDTPVTRMLTATDPDGPSLTYSIFMAPALGSITALDASTGAFTYTPNPGVTGLDVFTFRVTDGEFTDEGTIRLAIQGAQPTVMVSGGDLLVIGTPDPDMIIITHVSAGIVRVRTDLATAHYPVSGQLIVNSGQGNDYVVATSVQVPTTLDLAEGDDYGASGMQNDLIIGGAGNDQINGSGGDNVIWGDTVGEQDLATGGKDVISSLDGNDVIYAGGQNDQVYSGGGDDYVNAGQGDDVVSAGAGNDRVYGGAGADQLFGDEGADLLSGGDGGDMLVGRTGTDVLIGGLGADTLNGDEGADLLFGNNTTNSASTSFGDANDLALMAMLNAWSTSRPSGLATPVSAGNDGSPDQLLGYTSDDDFYVSTNDSMSDFGATNMGNDRFFSV